MKKQITINSQTFNSKAEIQEFAKSILYNSEINTTLCDDELSFMYEYFELFHLDWDIKMGVGIKNIWRIKEPKYGKYRAFMIERIDGTQTDISYYINNTQKKDYNREFRQALRECIEPQTRSFKEELFKRESTIICPLTNQLLSFDNCHIDHENPTFERLVTDFIHLNKIELHPGLFPPEKDFQIRYDITDESIKRDFYEYHKANAKLRAVLIDANLRRKKK